jgi:F-type H+-transporting ATPase subunit delta
VAEVSSPESGVAERYANALFEIAVEQDQLKPVEEDLNRLAALIDESADLKRLIRSPVFSAEDQARAMGAILDKAGIGGGAANFLRVVTGNRRLFALPDMIAAFRRLAARQRGEVSAEVTSAEPLSEKHLGELKAALRDKLGKDVTLATKVDPSLIGGLIVKVGSRMVDSSIKSKLQRLTLVMKGVG